MSVNPQQERAQQIAPAVNSQQQRAEQLIRRLAGQTPTGHVEQALAKPADARDTEQRRGEQRLADKIPGDRQ